MTENVKVGDPIGIAEGHAPSEQYHAEEDERKLVGGLQSLFDDAYRHRSPFEHTWQFNRLYLRGDQILVRDRSTGEVSRITVNRDARQRLFAIENLMRSNGRALVGKLTRIIPSVEVNPASDDSSELRAAEVSETFVEHITRKLNLRVKYLQGQRSLVWAGHTVYELGWDRKGGRDIAMCPSNECTYLGNESEVGIPCPACQIRFEQQANMEQDKMGQAYVAMQQQSLEFGTPPPSEPPQVQAQQAPILTRVNEGEIEVNRLSVGDFFPEPGIEDSLKWRYAFTRRAYPITEIRAMFPDKAKHLSAEDGLYNDKSLSFYGSYLDERGSTNYLEDHAYLTTYHQVPDGEHKEGRLIRFCNDIIVEDKPHPLYKLLGRLPFYTGRYEYNEGEYWGEAPITQAWHIQRERNRLLTQTREHRELTMKPKLLNPQGNKIGVSEIDTTPGQILPTTTFGKDPKYLEIPILPDYVYNELNRMEMAIRQLFGITEQEAGMAGDQSGRAAAILEAQSSESISPVIVENNAEWVALYRGILLVAHEFYTDERIWTIRGRDRVRCFAWRDAKLKEGWDVQLAETDSLSKNPAIRQQQLNELWDRGIFLDPATGVNDTRTYLRLANIRLPGVGPDTEASEHAYFASLPERIKKGIPFAPRPWDDPWVAQEELAAWLRGPGREDEDEMLVMQVGQIYIYYSSMLPYTPLTMQVAPNALAQQPMQPGGGEGSGALGMGAGYQQGGPSPAQRTNPQQQGPIAMQAAQQIQQVDAQNEDMARMQAQHEG